MSLTVCTGAPNLSYQTTWEQCVCEGVVDPVDICSEHSGQLTLG